MLLMKDRSFLYELRTYLIYVKVGENCQKKKQNKCCDHSIEPSRRDIPLNYITPSYLEI